VRYQENRTYEQSKRAARVIGTAGVLGLAFIGGTLHGRARFGETPAANAGTSVAPSLVRSVASPAGPAWDLPNMDHPRVDYWVNSFSTRKKDEFAKYLERSGKYAPMISRKLEERGMPQDLLYLAMIESGFNPKAYSPAAASGLWQFIGETGRRYGLDINNAVDERNDPEKATDAALTYLKELHDRFGSWYLAAAAYNTGENRVARIMREETGSEKGTEGSYYEIWNRLPRETRDYVPLMVAAARISKEPGRYGFDDVEMEKALTYDEVEVEPSSSLEAIAEAAGTTLAEVKRLNPQLKLSRTRNDQKSTVRVPAGGEESFAANWATVSARHAALAKVEAKKQVTRTAALKQYKVRRGDSLSTIARRHGVSVASLKRANGLASTRIRAGATLRIPARG
jgi:membrane-bound lytic murein transglycosylase D